MTISPSHIFSLWMAQYIGWRQLCTSSSDSSLSSLKCFPLFCKSSLRHWVLWWPCPAVLLQLVWKKATVKANLLISSRHSPVFSSCLFHLGVLTKSNRTSPVCLTQSCGWNVGSTFLKTTKNVTCANNISS